MPSLGKLFINLPQTLPSSTDFILVVCRGDAPTPHVWTWSVAGNDDFAPLSHTLPSNSSSDSKRLSITDANCELQKEKNYNEKESKYNDVVTLSAMKRRDESTALVRPKYRVRRVECLLTRAKVRRSVQRRVVAADVGGLDRVRASMTDVCRRKLTLE